MELLYAIRDLDLADRVADSTSEETGRAALAQDPLTPGQERVAQRMHIPAAANGHAAGPECP